MDGIGDEHDASHDIGFDSRDCFGGQGVRGGNFDRWCCSSASGTVSDGSMAIELAAGTEWFRNGRGTDEQQEH